MSFFDNLFGKPKPKVTPEQAKNIEQKRNELKIHQTVETMKAKQDHLDLKIKNLEKLNEQDTRLALQAKNAGQKDKALRFLASVKGRKAEIAKISGMSLMLSKQISNLENSKDDSNLAVMMNDANKIVSKNLENQDKFLETIQDTAQINNEYDMHQDQVNDLLKGINERHMEGLEDDLKELEELEMMDAMKNANTKKQPVVVNDVSKQKTVQVQTQPQAKKKDSKFDDMITTLLN